MSPKFCSNRLKNEIHLPGIFVQRIVLGQNYEKRIEQKTTI